MRLGIDLDGCGYDFVADATRACAAGLGVHRDTLAPATCWEFFREWGLGGSAFWDHVRNGHDRGEVWHGPPVAHFVPTLEHLRRMGHTVHIVTARPRWATATTARWIEEWGVPYDTFTIAEDKTAVPVDLFVEDSPANIEALTAAGTATVRFHRPWNDHLPAAMSIAEWFQLVDILEEAA